MADSRAVYPYDEEDTGLIDSELEAKYGYAGHPYHTLEKWRALQANGGDANHNGYWDFVSNSIDYDDFETTKAAAPASDTVDIEDVDTFARAVAHWHGNVLARVEHYLTIPPGTEIEVTENGVTQKIILTGEVLGAFKAAIMTAANEFRELPFMVSGDATDIAANDAASPAQ